MLTGIVLGWQISAGHHLQHREGQMKPLASPLPTTLEVCYCVETWGKSVWGLSARLVRRQEATGGGKYAFYQPLHICKKARGCCTVPCREEQLLTSITMSTARRSDGDKSVLPSPTCSAQLSPRLLPCSVAFCLPCNHYNTSFPLASQCLDTHGEMQPGTTHSIKGCPLQRKGGGIYQSHCAEALHSTLPDRHSWEKGTILFCKPFSKIVLYSCCKKNPSKDPEKVLAWIWT